MNIQELEIEHNIDTGIVKIYRKTYEHGFISAPGLELVAECPDIEHAWLTFRSILLNT